MRSTQLPRGTAGCRLLLSLGLERGLTVDRCLRGTGIDPEQLGDPLGEVSRSAEVRLIENLVAALGQDAGLGLEAGRRHVFLGSGTFGFGCLSSPTLRASLAFAVRYQDLALTLARADLVEAERQSFIQIDVSDLPSTIQRFVVDQCLAAIWTALPAIAGSPPPPLVELGIRRPVDAARYGELFGVDPEFQRPIARVGLPNAYLDAPLPQADAAALEVCEQQCSALLEQRAMRVGVTGLVRDRLTRAGRGIPSMETVATDIHMTTRTLRRKLAEEGTSFREVDRAVRLERAERLLRETDLSVKTIAQRAGYASSSSFVHAFIRWRSTTPRDYRRHC